MTTDLPLKPVRSPAGCKKSRVLSGPRKCCLAALCLALLSGCAGQTTPTPETLALRQMCDELKRELFRDPVVRSFLIYPRCEPGIVTLNGSVRDYDGWEEAGRIAAGMPGVQRVQNNLRILEEDSLYPNVE